MLTSLFEFADLTELVATRNKLGEVFAEDWQLIWWNRGWAGLLGDHSSTPPQLRNFARDTFPIDG
jgi:hypothetical protein